MLNEQKIADQLKSGELKGIVLDGEFAYLPLRLTGTGERKRLNEDGETYRKVNRDLKTFSTQELMDSYANVNVVLDHPVDEEGNKVRAGYDNGIFIGNTIDSYIKEDDKEIWVIARLHNKEVIDYLLENDDLSTSPHFATSEVFDGEVYHEIPIGVNSLAIVSEGFWDKSSTKPAIDNSEINLTKEVIMKEDKSDSVLERSADSTQEKADDTNSEEEKVKEEVAELKDNEVKEAEKFQELANQHEEFKEEKGDSMSEKKIEKIEKEEKNDKVDSAQITDMSHSVYDDWNDPNKKIAKISLTAKGDTVEEVEAKLDEVLNNENTDSNEKIDSDEVITDDYVTEGDKDREKVIKVLHDVADSVRDLGIKIPCIDKRVKKEVVIREFAKNNPSFVPEKYKGFVEKIDSSVGELTNDMLNSMIENIKNKNSELMGDTFSKQGLNHKGQRVLHPFKRF